MSWEQEAFATPRLQPPTPSATPRSAKASGFDAANYETPRSNMATFESFFPFSTSPLQPLSDVYERDAEPGAAPASLALEGESHPPRSDDLQSDAAPPRAEAVPQALSSPVLSLSSHAHGAAAVVDSNAKHDDYDWTSLFADGTLNRSQDSIQTPPPTVSSTTISPTAENKRRRGGSDEQRRSAAADLRPGDEVTPGQPDILDPGRPRRPRVRPTHFSSDVLSAVGHPTSAPAIGPTHTMNELFWDRGSLQSGAGAEGFPRRYGRLDAEDSDGDGRARRRTQHLSGRRTLDHVTGPFPASRQAPPREDGSASISGRLPGLYPHPATEGAGRSRTRTASSDPQRSRIALEPYQLHSSLDRSSHRSSQENSPVRGRELGQQAGPAAEDPWWHGQRSFSQQRQREHLKPRSNNGAGAPLFGELQEQRPTVKRRCTDHSQSRSQLLGAEERPRHRGQSLALPAEADGSVRETKRLGNPNARAERHASTSNSSSQASVLFTIDETGRAKAERKVVEEDLGEADVVPTLWEVEDDEATSSDDDLDFTTSRNTSFAVPDPDVQTSRRNRSQRQPRSSRQSLSVADLDHLEGDDQAASSTYAGLRVKRKLRGGQMSGRRIYASDEELSGTGNSASEAETVRDNVIEDTRHLLARGSGSHWKEDDRNFASTAPARFGSAAASQGRFDLQAGSSTSRSTASRSRHDKENREDDDARMVQHRARHPASSSASHSEPDQAIVCICGDPHPGKQLIQCEACATWQHVRCMGLKTTALPHVYQCTKCADRTSRIRASRLQHRKERSHKSGAATSSQKSEKRQRS